MDSGILMIQDSILVCSPDPRIPHTAAAARQMRSANMSRKVTTKEFEEYVATIKDKESKKAYKRWWHKSGEAWRRKLISHIGGMIFIFDSNHQLPEENREKMAFYMDATNLML
jgi:hypothetical protein